MSLLSRFQAWRENRRLIREINKMVQEQSLRSKLVDLERAVIEMEKTRKVR